MLPDIHFSPVRDKKRLLPVVQGLRDLSLFEQPSFSLASHIHPFKRSGSRAIISKKKQEDYLRTLVTTAKARSTPTITIITGSPNEVRPKLLALWLVARIWNRYDKEQLAVEENRRELSQMRDKRGAILIAPVKPIIHWMSVTNVPTEMEKDILNRTLRPQPHFLVITGVFNNRGDEIADPEACAEGARMSTYKREKLRSILDLYDDTHRIIVGTGMSPTTLTEELQIHFNYGFQLFSARQNVYPTKVRSMDESTYNAKNEVY